MSRKARQRTSRLPIRMQLMLPIAAALMGMLVLGLFHTVQVWSSYQDATDAQVLTDLSKGLSDTLDGHQNEGAPLLEGVLTGSVSEVDVEALRATTDEAITEFDAASEEAAERFPSLRPALDELSLRLEAIDGAREGIDLLAAGEAGFEDEIVVEAFEDYRTIAERIVDLAARLPGLVDNSGISSQLDALASSMQAGRLASELQFRVTADLARLEAEQALAVDREALSLAAYLSGEFDRQVRDFQVSATDEVAAVYERTIGNEQAVRAREALTVFLNGDIPRSMDAADFSAAQGSVVEALHQTQSRAMSILVNDVEELRDASTRTLLTTFALLIVLAMTAIISAAMLARRISLRVDGVREATLTAAYDTLPKTVAAVSQAGNADEVDRLLEAAKQQTVISTDARYADELDSLAEAFSAAHHQALRQTANQALLRLDVEAMMKTLARRGQSLIRRQQQVMEDLAEDSTGPIPEEWRSVYHLMSRMRRNEENLLLLAGGEPQRRYDRPTDLAEIIRDAVGEIEGAGRVLVENQVSVFLETKPAGDVVRILAELLDNAAAYSPPSQQVRVTSRRSGSEIVISVADDGIGLGPEQMAAINRRLAEPTQLNSELTATMGLLVVGRLAAEHSIGVQLHSTMGKGTLALVRLPSSLQDESRTVAAPLSSARRALAAQAANLPVTGTGSEADADGAAEPIVPKPRRAGAIPEPRPVAGTEPGARPSAGVADEPVGVTFRKVKQRALESPGRANGAELPQRTPGSRLLPGAVPGPQAGGVADLDPAEIRDRLTGFASGIAAASEQEQR